MILNNQIRSLQHKEATPVLNVGGGGRKHIDQSNLFSKIVTNQIHSELLVNEIHSLQHKAASPVLPVEGKHIDQSNSFSKTLTNQIHPL